MVNSVQNEIYFASKNKEKIEKLYEFITQPEINGENFGIFLSNFGDICKVSLEKYSSIEKRKDLWCFNLCLISDSDHYHNAYVKFLKDFDSDNKIKIFHKAEEISSELFLNTDTEGIFFPDRYYLYWLIENHYSKKIDWITEKVYLTEEYEHLNTDDLYKVAKAFFKRDFSDYNPKDLLEYLREQGLRIGEYATC